MVSQNTAYFDKIDVQIQNEMFYDDPTQFKIVQNKQAQFMQFKFTETVPR